MVHRVILSSGICTSLIGWDGGGEGKQLRDGRGVTALEELRARRTLAAGALPEFLKKYGRGVARGVNLH